MSCQKIVKATPRLKKTGLVSIWSFPDTRVFQRKDATRVQISVALKKHRLHYVTTLDGWQGGDIEIARFAEFVADEELYLGRWTALACRSGTCFIAFEEEASMVKFKLFIDMETKDPS